jgi:hypothetical protein
MPTARSIFQKVDTMDPHALDDLLAEDARMVFGNGEPFVGREAITSGCAAFRPGAGIRALIGYPVLPRRRPAPPE